MKYTADCPQCKMEFEIGGPRAAEAGLKCPYCATGFIPEKIHKVTIPQSQPATARKPAPVQHSDSVKEVARILSRFSIVLFVIGVVSGFLTIVAAGSKNELWICVGIASGALSLCFWVSLLAQLMHIRAALESKDK